MASENQKLGKNIQKQRKACGLTQDELADQAGVSYSTVTKIERGAIASPSVFTVACLAEVLGVSVEELIGTKKSPSSDVKPTKTSKTFFFCDVNGVLVRFFQRAFVDIADNHNLSLDRVETAFWHYNDAGNRGEMSLAEFNSIMAETLKIKHFDWEASYLGAVEPITAMHDCLRQISKTHRLGLLTNIHPGFLNQMIKQGLAPDLDYDCIVDSSEVKAIKPEQKMFEIAERMAGAKGEDILFVDDSRTNLMAAGRLGWRGLWFDDFRPEDSVKRVKEALTE